MKSVVRNQSGMTLVEIMIVLVILAGLSAALITQVSGQLARARMREAKILMSEVGKALDLYNADCGGYPESLEALVNDPGTCSSWGPESYMKRLPKDPWNMELGYQLDGGNYILISYGSDKKEGGTGEAADITSDQL